MEPYEITASKLNWATRKNKALRSAIAEVAPAITALKRASAQMKKASRLCKQHPESDCMESFADEIARMQKALSEFDDDWRDDANALWLGILKYQEREGMKNDGNDAERVGDRGPDCDGKLEDLGGTELL